MASVGTGFSSCHESLSIPYHFLVPFAVYLPNVHSVKDDVEQGGGVLLVDLASWGDEDADCPRFDHTSGYDGSGGRGHACRCVRC